MTDDQQESGGDQVTDWQDTDLTGMNSLVMTADQIVSILKQQPDALASAKEVAGQLAGIDPETITDETLYSRIHQDANLRGEISQELNRLGYSTNPVTKPTNQQADGSNGNNSNGNSNNNSSSMVRQNSIQTQQQNSNQTAVKSRQQPIAPVDRDQPQVVRRRGPYGDLASMRDLYSQLRPEIGKLKRFGVDTFRMDTFRVASGAANQQPMDMPVGPEYVLGPGDSIVVNMWGGQSSRLVRAIDRQGQIELPEAGTVALAGLTIAQAQTAIEKTLNTQFQNEHVEISLGRLRTVRIYVVGDVQRPGAYDISSLSTAMNALLAAGGPTSNGSLRQLKQYRGTQLVGEIDLYDFLLNGIHANSERLLSGDTILVPPVGPQVSVAGMVRRPAIYELKDEVGLKDVINLAGGVLASASLKHIQVERIEAHERRTMLNVQLPDANDKSDDSLSAFKVRDGDSVLVSQILPYNEQAVYLEGHVFRPGKYSYRDGMTLNDVLHSYQDIMPEPSDHAEIVRLLAPDFRPETISVNLHDALSGSDSILLRPFDLIRIYGRYEIDPPRVSIYGEVVRPGQYPMAENLTVTGLVQMAGGFKRSAYREVADLSSYAVEDGEKVVLAHQPIEVQKAIDGDARADVVLKAGDIVSIRQLSGWKDIGAAVKVSGEVAYAGTYGINEREHLSSVLLRAGGYRPDAFPAGAVLERVQVRELAEYTRQAMIQRIETTPIGVSQGLTSAQDQTALQQTAQLQQQQVLESLRSHPASGRQVIKITADIQQWQNTPADIELRAGDTLMIPKQANFVIVSGQVYNATAISYTPGKDAAWYLAKAGGATPSGNRRSVFVLRADGSVVGHGSSWKGSNVLNLHMQPGDAVVVPEKVIGGSQVWKNVVSLAQIMSSVAITGAVAGIF